MEPRASGSGLMWHASAVSSPASRASAARFSASLIFLLVDTRQDLFDPLASFARIVLGELELGSHLQPDLASENHPEVRTRGPERCPGPSVLLLLAQDRVEDARLAEIGRDPHSGHGNEAEPGILQPRDLLGEDLPELFV